jgi:hypothetical protein
VFTEKIKLLTTSFISPSDRKEIVYLCDTMLSRISDLEKQAEAKKVELGCKGENLKNIGGACYCRLDITWKHDYCNGCEFQCIFSCPYRYLICDSNVHNQHKTYGCLFYKKSFFLKIKEAFIYGVI